MTTEEDSYGAILDERNVAGLERALVNRLMYLLGKDPVDTTQQDWFQALAYVVRELLTTHWMESMRSYYLQDAKRLYYLSMECARGVV